MMRPNAGEAAKYRELVVARYLIFWLHVALVFILTMEYIYKVPLARLPWCVRTCGTQQIVRAAALTLPYFVSLINTRNRFATNWGRMTAFSALLIGGAIVIGTTFSEASTQDRLTTAMLVSTLATFVYLVGARLLLREADGV